MADEEASPDTHRLLLLTDGVFAIAATLLVLDVRLPEGATSLQEAILDVRAELAAYVFSFLVIYSFWIGHQRVFRTIARADSMLVWLNGLFLLCVAFLPFPVATFGAHSDDRLAVVLYAFSMALTSVMFAAIWWYAIRHPDLLKAPASRAAMRAAAARSIAIPVIFAASIALAGFSARVAEGSWVLALIVPPLLVRLYRSRRRRASTACGEAGEAPPEASPTAQIGP